MEETKQSFWLALFELKKSKSSILVLLLSLLLFVPSLSTMWTAYIEKNFAGLDAFFLILFSIWTVWLRPKDFQYQKGSDGTWGTAHMSFLLPLAIPRMTIINSRLIAYFCLSFPFQLLLLVLMYMYSSDLREAMTIFSYSAFSVIWLSFGIWGGGAFPASDIGDRISGSRLVLGILFYIGLFAALLSLYFLTGGGLVKWTMEAAVHFPFWSIIISVLLAAVSLLYYRNYMQKKLEQVDYLG
ncbi:hypothetical protein [Domibacillus indicus]|uniref:hypothetical protein n=1 Tax=Domibacillus indicus TaxID=1437523 RepID=UPI000617D5B9|nr:hypothetical protein [Domibacillus indicus]